MTGTRDNLNLKYLTIMAMSYAYQSVQRPQDENQPVIHSNSNIVNITPGIHQAVSSEYRGWSNDVDRMALIEGS